MDIKKLIAGAAALVMAGSVLTACDDKDKDKDDDKKSSSKAVVTEAVSGSDEEVTTTTAPEEEEPETVELEKLEIPASESKSPVLEEVGKITDDSLRFTDDLIYSGDSEETVMIHDYLGNKLADGKAGYVTKLGDTGLYAYYLKGGDIAYQGLITAEGEEIVSPDEKVGLFREIDDRFIMAFFPEGTTTNEDEAIYYVTANQFSFMPNDDDILYTGKVKVYDTVNKKFLENTTVTESPSYHIYGDIVSFYDKDMNTVYVSADDKVIEPKEGFNAAGARFFTGYAEGSYQTLDHDMNLVMSGNTMVSGFDSTKYYVGLFDSESSSYGLADWNLETVIEPKYKSINALNDTMFQYSTNDDFKYGLVTADGTEITKDEYDMISETDTPGYYACKKSDGTYDLINSEGKIVDSGSTDGYYGLASKKDGDAYVYLVANTGEFSIKTENSLTDFGKGIAYDSKAHVLYDIYTGDKLAEGFDNAYTAYGYIYVIKGTEATVYAVK